MAVTHRIKRRLAGGAAGAPSSLKNAELAFNEQDNTLYYGKGDSGGNATAIIPIAGDAKLSDAPSTGTTYGRNNGAWTAISAGGIPEAPSDSALYGRVNASWAKAVKLAGDTMTGTLVLSAGVLQINATGATDNGIQVRSGATASRVAITVGRTSSEGFMAVAGAANDYVSGSAAGDIWFGKASTGGKVWLGNNISAKAAQIDASGNFVLPTGAAYWVQAGSVQFTGGDASIQMARSTNAQICQMRGDEGANQRWLFRLVDAGATGNLAFYRYTDAGVYIDLNMQLTRGAAGTGGTMLLNYQSSGGPAGLQQQNKTSGGSGNFQLYYRDDGVLQGYIQGNGASGVTFGNSSDAALKEDIRPLREVFDSKKIIAALKPRRWRGKGENYNTPQEGFVAQEVHEAFDGQGNVALPPQQVLFIESGTPDAPGGERLIETPWSVNYDGFTPYIIDAMQLMQEQIDMLTAQLQALQAQVNAMQGQT